MMRALLDHPAVRRRMDALAARCGYHREALRLEGHVFVRQGDAPEVYLGQNLLTDTMRLHVAGLLARKLSDWSGVPAPTYVGDEGYTSADNNEVFPAKLAAGLGVAAASAEQRGLIDPLRAGGDIKYYPLERVEFYRHKGGYPSGVPISCSFYFRLPVGEVYDDEGTEVDVQEWGLFMWNAPANFDPDVDTDGGLLARKVAKVTKRADLELTVRWEIRT